jgi:hypothetical protein
VTTKRKGPPRPGRPRVAGEVRPDAVPDAAPSPTTSPTPTNGNGAPPEEAMSGEATSGAAAGPEAGEVQTPAPVDAGGHSPDGPFEAGAEPARAGRPALSPAWAKRLDIGITVAGLVVVTLLATGLAIIEALYSPLRVGGVPLPVSLVMAVATNPLLGWFAFATTGRRFAALVPAAAWCVIWILAAGRTTEGDLVITDDNWVGLLTLFSGPVAFAIGIYISALRQRMGPGVVVGPANSKAAGLAPRSVDG